LLSSGLGKTVGADVDIDGRLCELAADIPEEVVGSGDAVDLVVGFA
jgi:hypothetical protein